VSSTLTRPPPPIACCSSSRQRRCAPPFAAGGREHPPRRCTYLPTNGPQAFVLTQGGEGRGSTIFERSFAGRGLWAVSVFSQTCDAGRVAALARGNRASIADGFVDAELVASPTSRLQRVGRGLPRHFELTREPLVVRHPVSLSGEMRSHLLDDPRGRWHHTKSDPASAIDDGFAIHEDFILPVAATDRFHLDSEFTTEPCRHTDGM